MTWTMETPRAEGLCWFWKQGMDAATLVLVRGGWVYPIDDDEGLLCCALDDRLEWPVGGWWCGPLVPPPAPRESTPPQGGSAPGRFRLYGLRRPR